MQGEKTGKLCSHSILKFCMNYLRLLFKNCVVELFYIFVSAGLLLTRLDGCQQQEIAYLLLCGTCIYLVELYRDQIFNIPVNMLINLTLFIKIKHNFI